MELDERARRFVKPYRIADGRRFRLRDFDPGDTGHLSSEDEDVAKAALQEGVEQLAELQSKLYAQDRWAVLLVFQAMDAAGKDGTIKHVMSGVNPQGVQVYSFKAPLVGGSRPRLPVALHALPARAGPDRHLQPVVLRGGARRAGAPRDRGAQKLPPELVGKHLFEERYEDIRGFERYLSRNGVVILKFLLHVSKAEQKRRFLARLDEPKKNWKFSAGDLAERGYWKDYQRAYEDAIRATAAPHHRGT